MDLDNPFLRSMRLISQALEPGHRLGVNTKTNEWVDLIDLMATAPIAPGIDIRIETISKKILTIFNDSPEESLSKFYEKAGSLFHICKDAATKNAVKKVISCSVNLTKVTTVADALRKQYGHYGDFYLKLSLLGDKVIVYQEIFGEFSTWEFENNPDSFRERFEEITGKIIKHILSSITERDSIPFVLRTPTENDLNGRKVVLGYSIEEYGVAFNVGFLPSDNCWKVIKFGRPEQVQRLINDLVIIEKVIEEVAKFPTEEIKNVSVAIVGRGSSHKFREAASTEDEVEINIFENTITLRFKDMDSPNSCHSTTSLQNLSRDLETTLGIVALNPIRKLMAARGIHLYREESDPKEDRFYISRGEKWIHPQTGETLFNYDLTINGELSRRLTSSNVEIRLRELSEFIEECYKEFEKLKPIFKELVAQYGANILIKSNAKVTLEAGQFKIQKGGVYSTFYYLSFDGKVKKLRLLNGEVIFRKAVAIKRYYYTCQLIRKYAKREDAIPFQYSTDNNPNPKDILDPHYNSLWVDACLDSRVDIRIRYWDLKGNLHAEYIGSGEEEFDRTLRKLYQLKKEVDRLYEEKYLQVTAKLRTTTRTSGEVPPLLPDMKVELLRDLFQQLNFTKKEEPFYINPQTIKEGKNVVSIEALAKNLDAFIQKVSEESPHYGIPEEEQPTYYRNLKAYLSHVIAGLLNKDVDPSLKQDILLSFCIGGTACGGRWSGLVLQQYNALTGKQSGSLEEIFLGFIDHLKMGIIENIVAKSGGGTHQYIAICKVLTQTTDIALPGKEMSNYSDPYVQDFGFVDKYRNVEEIKAGYRELLTGVEVISSIVGQANELLAKTNRKFLAEMLPLFRESASKRIPQDVLVNIETQYLTRKAQIENASELNPQFVKNVIEEGRGLLKSLTSIPTPSNANEFQRLQIDLLNRFVNQLRNCYEVVEEKVREDEELDEEALKRNEFMDAFNAYKNEMNDLQRELLNHSAERRISLILKEVDPYVWEHYLIDTEERVQLTRKGAYALLIKLGFLEK